MTTTDAPMTVRTPWHLWVVGIIAVLWNGFGGYDYIMTQTRNDAYLAQFTDAQRAYFESFPLWMEVVWALGVWGSVLGSILLLVRSRFAFHAFAVSLAAMLISLVYSFGLSNGADVMGPTGAVFSAVIVVIIVFLAWYARTMAKRRVLR